MTARHDATDQHQDDERPIRVLFVTVPRCPTCRSPKLRPYRTTRLGPAGSVARVRYCRCEQCGQRTHLHFQ